MTEDAAVMLRKRKVTHDVTAAAATVVITGDGVGDGKPTKAKTAAKVTTVAVRATGTQPAQVQVPARLTACFSSLSQA